MLCINCFDVLVGTDRLIGTVGASFMEMHWSIAPESSKQGLPAIFPIKLSVADIDLTEWPLVNGRRICAHIHCFTPSL